MEGKKILVVEDEAEIRELIKICLSSHHYVTVFAHDGQEALWLFEKEEPDLILLDILLPKLDGIQVCKEIRKYSNVPIVFMSCKQEAEDIIEGLELGGDDYITKPFDLNVLVARVKANLRRAPIFNRGLTAHDELEKEKESLQDNLHIIKFKDFTINLLGNEVVMGKTPITFSVKEIQLLSFLVLNPNKVFSTEELYQRVWGTDSYGDSRTVSVHISNIRKKIEPDPSQPHYIHNVRGYGYKFVAGDSN